MEFIIAVIEGLKINYLEVGSEWKSVPSNLNYFF